MPFSCECCVLSDRGLCYGSPTECVCVCVCVCVCLTDCNLETSSVSRSRPTRAVELIEKKYMVPFTMPSLLYDELITVMVLTLFSYCKGKD